MPSLAIVRDVHLNPWDCGNYYGVVSHGIDLYLCGRGPHVRWDEIRQACPKAKTIQYTNPWEVLELEPDVIDVPDAHYGFSQYYAERHNRVIVVAWDNLPGKNTLNQAALTAAGKKAWKHVARSNLAREMLIWEGVHPNRIEIIPGAVDIEFFHPNDEPRENAVLFVGRLVLEKGLLDLIWAMKGLGAELWVVGEGDKEYFQRWIDLAGIQHRWFGFLNRQELAQVYRRAKALCVPSIPKLDLDPFGCWLEQFGQVFIEAMASGTPIVSTFSGAIPEVVAGAGICVPPRDWALLHSKLDIMLNDRKRWETYSRAARALAEMKFAQDVVGKRIKEWYFK